MVEAAPSSDTRGDEARVIAPAVAMARRVTARLRLLQGQRNRARGRGRIETLENIEIEFMIATTRIEQDPLPRTT
jgi:hypothetical protein